MATNERSFPSKWIVPLSRIADVLDQLVDVNHELEEDDMFIYHVEVVVRHNDDFQVGTFHLEDDWFMYNPGGEE